MADSLKPDVIIGTESWLLPENKEKGIFNSEIFPEGYKQSVARRDRQEVPRYEDTDVRGGGVFILLKDDIIGVRQAELETDCEIVWTKFNINGCKSVYVAAYYRPHENDKPSIEELQKSLERITNSTTSHVWIGGDFNLPGYNWVDGHMKKGCRQPELTRHAIDIAADSGLTQIVKEPTYYENTLDLFFTNNPSLVFNSQVIPGISSDGHHAVYVEIDVAPIRKTLKPRKVHSYKKADWEGLKSHIEEVSKKFIEETTEDTPVEDLWQRFTTEIDAAIEKYVPSRMTKSRERPPWVTPAIGKLLKKQKRLFGKQRGSAYNSRASKHYRSMKAYTQREIRRAYWNHVEGIIDGGSGDDPQKSQTRSSTTSSNTGAKKHKVLLL
jgi:hypothetical protein